MTDMPDWDDDILGEDTADEGLIELTDIVEDSSGEADDDAVIELTQIAEPEDSGPELELDDAENNLDFGDDFLDQDASVDEEDTGLETLEMPEPEEDEAPAAEELVVPETVIPEAVQDIAVGSEVFEAALERVIEKKFADKIETILFEVMEKVIEKEIAQIRESLQKDLDQIGHS